MIVIHPKEIKGSWDQGYVLDVHTISRTMVGDNEIGHPEFDTLRSEQGEMVYRLKYGGDKGAIASVVEAIVPFRKGWGIHPDALVPISPSKQRSFQPVLEIAAELARSLHIELNTESLNKNKATQQMKDVGDYGARVATLGDRTRTAFESAVIYR